MKFQDYEADNLDSLDNDAGNLTRDHNGYEYSYDYENRLREITDGTDTVAVYTYDALGRRIEKIEYDAGAADTTTRYYYDGWRVLVEADGADSEERAYIYGNYLDEVLVKTEDTAATDDIACWADELLQQRSPQSNYVNGNAYRTGQLQRARSCPNIAIGTFTNAWRVRELLYIAQ